MKVGFKKSSMFIWRKIESCGYRNSSSHWNVVVPKKSLILGSDDSWYGDVREVPEGVKKRISIVPVEIERFVVLCEEELITQYHSDPHPVRKACGNAELSYGTSICIEGFQFCLLTAEQHEKYANGEIALPKNDSVVSRVPIPRNLKTEKKRKKDRFFVKIVVYFILSSLMIVTPFVLTLYFDLSNGPFVVERYVKYFFALGIVWCLEMFVFAKTRQALKTKANKKDI